MTGAENQEPYVFDQSASAERAEGLTGQLVAFNQRHRTALPIEYPDPLPLHLFVLDRAGTVLGGVLGRTHAIPWWFEISAIWIEERLRQHGLGRRLMELAERIAAERGCQYARLATSNFQAPLFYQKLGYQLYGTLDDCPPGETVFYLWKTPGPHSPDGNSPSTNGEGLGGSSEG